MQQILRDIPSVTVVHELQNPKLSSLRIIQTGVLSTVDRMRLASRVTQLENNISNRFGLFRWPYNDLMSAGIRMWLVKPSSVYCGANRNADVRSALLFTSASPSFSHKGASPKCMFIVDCREVQLLKPDCSRGWLRPSYTSLLF